MKRMLRVIVLMSPFLAASGWGEEATSTALTCDDFVPTKEALERFPDLKGACEAVIERNGELYGLFRAIVRKPGSRSVTLYLPVTDHTFVVKPEGDARVLIGNQKVRPRDLQRGQEISIYLAAQAFSSPDIDEVAFITAAEVIIAHPVESASQTLVAKPARVLTSMVKSGAIVEAVNKETRELKLIDPAGNRFTVVADGMVRNFDQIEPRDRIVVEYLESIALVVAPQGSEPPIGDADVLNVAAAGDKPGVQGVTTRLVVATIRAINSGDRLVTLESDDGAVSTIKVADDARLDMVDVGDQVRLRVTRAVAVSVVKPDAE